MKYNSNYYTKEAFIDKFQKLLNERYADLAEHKRRSKFCNDYKDKFPDENDIESAVKQWFSLGNKNTRKPSIEKLMNICELLNCDIDYFLTEQREFKKDVANASEVTGLSYKAIENLSKYSRGNTASQKIDFQFINTVLSSKTIYTDLVPLLSSFLFYIDVSESREIESLYNYKVANSDKDDLQEYVDTTIFKSVTYDYNGRLYYPIPEDAFIDTISLSLIRTLTKLNLKEKKYRESHDKTINIIVVDEDSEYDDSSNLLEIEEQYENDMLDMEMLKEKNKAIEIRLNGSTI